MDLELSDKVVLITGGSDGLGAATAQRLVHEGARVALCARRPGPLEELASRLVEMGGDVLGLVADVTLPEDVERFVAAAHDRWGRIDALVNNAGASAAGPFVAVTDEAWQADLDLKLFAAIRASRGAYPYLAEAGGAIVNVLAVSAKAPPARSAPTSVSRAAGLALTKALSKEFGSDGIRVNAVLVGIVESGQWTRLAERSGRSLDEVYASMAKDSGIPLGRVGRGEEFADLVSFLVSPRAAYVTGCGINFDGGLSSVV